jgi:hypothetical protein
MVMAVLLLVLALVVAAVAVLDLTLVFSGAVVVIFPTLWTAVGWLHCGTVASLSMCSTYPSGSRERIVSSSGTHVLMPVLAMMLVWALIPMISVLVVLPVVVLVLGGMRSQ